MGGVGEMLISEIEESIFDYPVSHSQNVKLIYITYNLSFEYRGICYTNTTSNQITGMCWSYTNVFITTPLSHSPRIIQKAD